MAKNEDVVRDANDAEVTSGEDVLAVSPISIDSAIERLKERHKAIVEALARETNIINRYELKIRAEEVVSIFNELVSIR